MRIEFMVAHMLDDSTLCPASICYLLGEQVGPLRLLSLHLYPSWYQSFREPSSMLISTRLLFFHVYPVHSGFLSPRLGSLGNK